MLCRMGASGAISVRAIANFTKANAGCALCAPGKTSRSCLPPTGVRPDFASILSRKNRSTISCRAPRSSHSAPLGALTCKFCQNWDISKARDLDRLQDVASPEGIADAAVRGGADGVSYMRLNNHMANSYS
jgi:hypothetical protein